MTRNLHNKSTKSRRSRPTKVPKLTTTTPRVGGRSNKGLHSSSHQNNQCREVQDDNISLHSNSDHHSNHAYGHDSDDDMGVQQGPSLPSSLALEARLDAQEARANARFERLETLIASALLSSRPQAPSQPPLTQPQYAQASTSQTMTPPSHSTLTLSAHSSDSPHTNATESEMDSVVPPPAVRQSFGLLVGEHVSKTLRQKIVTDKYVDMHDLLPENTKAEQHLVLTSSLSGDNLKLLKDSKDVKITLDQWNEAFAHYMAIYHTTVALNLQSNLFLEMLTYRRDINTLAEQGLPWWRYDSQFRRDRSVNPSKFTFATLRHDLIASLNAFPLNRQPSGSQTDQRRDIPKGYCFRYHTIHAKCENRQCMFKHECYQCNARHPIFLCTQ